MALTLAQQSMLQTNFDLLRRCEVAIYNKCAPIYVSGTIPSGVSTERQGVAKAVAKKIADTARDFAPRAAKQIILVVNSQMQQAEAGGATPTTFTNAQIGAMSDTSTLVPDAALVSAMDGFFLVVANDPTYVP